MMKRNIIIVLVTLLFLASSGTGVYFYMQWKKAVTVPSAAEEIEEVTSVLAGFMELPEGEEPTIATVVDREKLQDQPFFLNAQNGDKVIIYTNARKAILYRPETKKVVEVAPIFFDENTAQAEPAPEPVPETAIVPTATTPETTPPVQ